MFARHGIPEVVISDNGPQFSSESYERFAQQNSFKHITSSPYYPKSNGEAERAAKTVKNLLRNSGDPYLTLLAYRATPLQHDYSPAQLLMSRNLRTTLPEIRERRKPKVVDFYGLEEKDDCLKERQKQNHDTRHRAKELPQLEPGDYVWITDRETSGKVVEHAAPRSHIVETPEGSFCRNRKHLVRMPEPEIESVPDRRTHSEQTTTRVTRSKTGRAPQPPMRLDPSWN